MRGDQEDRTEGMAEGQVQFAGPEVQVENGIPNDHEELSSDDAVIDLDPPDSQNWGASLLLLAGKAKDEEGKGRRALVVANKYRIEQGLILLNHQPPKGRRGDPSRTEWHRERARDLGCDESYVRRMIATAETLVSGGLGQRVPIGILDRKFAAVRSATRRYLEHGDPNWKPASSGGDSPGGTPDLGKLKTRFERVVKKARDLAADVEAVAGAEPFWGDVLRWAAAAPGMPMPEDASEPPEPEPAAGKRMVNVVVKSEGAVGYDVGPKQRSRWDEKLNPGTRIRFLAGEREGCTGVLGRFETRTDSYLVTTIADRDGRIVPGKSGKPETARAPYRTRDRDWEVVDSEAGAQSEGRLLDPGAPDIGTESGLASLAAALPRRQKKRLQELFDEELNNLPIDPEVLSAARKKLMASGKPWATEAEAAAILAEGGDKDADAHSHRLRRADALLRAAARLAAETSTR